MERIIEVCCGSYEDCLNAFYGKAHRIELNSALHLGGLTPTIGTLKKVKEIVTIPVVTMVRPRGAGFCYNDKEYEVMKEDALLLLEHGSDGLVFGFLDQKGNLDIERNKEFVSMAKKYGKEAIFHRAFDCVKDPYALIEQLIELGMDRVLTSGLKEKAVQGKELIKDLQDKYGDKIQILPGSGINASNALDLMNETDVYQVHSSCKDWVFDPTTHMNEDVSYSYGKDGYYDIVSKELVEGLVESIK